MLFLVGRLPWAVFKPNLQKNAALSGPEKRGALSSREKRDALSGREKTRGALSARRGRRGRADRRVAEGAAEGGGAQAEGRPQAAAPLAEAHAPRQSRPTSALRIRYCLTFIAAI